MNQAPQTLPRKLEAPISRRAFLGIAAGAMLAVLGLGGLTGCASVRTGHDAGKALSSRQKPTSGLDEKWTNHYDGGTWPPYEPPLKPIYFDYDKSVIRPDQLETLVNNIKYIKDNEYFTVAIVGHCDERGSTEYNMALGYKRAESLKAYLVAHGIPAKRIKALSVGKERPADPRHCEEAWAKNRRALFLQIVTP